MGGRVREGRAGGQLWDRNLKRMFARRARGPRWISRASGFDSCMIGPRTGGRASFDL